MQAQAFENIPARAAGVLLHVSSLPSPYGIGSFGAAARRWVDFLRDAGQSYWQVLPLGPTSFGDSPYQSFSAFAGNPYFIDLDTLCGEGLLRREEFADIIWGHSPSAVDYDRIYLFREPVLRRAFARFVPDESYLAFTEANAFWLETYALYMAVKATQGQRSWIYWDEDIRLRRPEALLRLEGELAEDVRYHCFVQYMFFKQWHALRRYANDNGVQVIGDIPIYVSLDSADVWANRGLFQLDGDGLPLEVAGCPPDSFAPGGQLWGNPLYDWDLMARDGYAWWLQRMRASFELYDVLRIDHFRGLESYFAIPYGDLTAGNGRWRPGPGIGFVTAMQQGVPGARQGRPARIIAEDLGFLTDEVRGLLAASGYPGMKVLQFAFDSREPGDYSPYSYGENTVVYPGTHDNDTVKGWGHTAPADDVAHAMDYMGLTGKAGLPLGMIRLALQSRARLAVASMQDWLGLDSECRMNVPSTIGGLNWRWRLEADALTDSLAGEMLRMARLYGR